MDSSSQESSKLKLESNEKIDSELDEKLKILTKRINKILGSSSDQLSFAFQNTMNSFSHGSNLPEFHQQMLKVSTKIGKDLGRLKTENKALSNSIVQRQQIIDQFPLDHSLSFDASVVGKICRNFNSNLHKKLPPVE